LLSRYPCAPKICAPNDHLNTVSFYDQDGNLLSSTTGGVTTTYTYRSFAATKGLALRELRLAA
jgi:hypothetical protein